MKLRRLARIALYAAALVTGALFAHFDPGDEPTATNTVPNLFAPERAHAAESIAPVATNALAEAMPSPKPGAYGGGRIIEGATPHRLIFFTFDDGPDRRTTPLLLDRLDAVGIKAAFFLTASRIAGHNAMEREQAMIAREIQARGHLIGSHTVDHIQLPLLGDADA
ncbi:MAG TPA: polysaccharide deacetylase family protein, partial [Polyangiales bacterium]|nr:polysaccharide deacetylase family protein [Polyangiales bacterium]